MTVLKTLCSVCLVFLLLACSSHIQPSADLAKRFRDDFTSALRWKQYKVAAGHMQEEKHRKEFLARFDELRDLHIVDVKLLDVQSSDAEQRFDTDIEMEYYLPPSVTLKTFRFQQSWEFNQGENPMKQGYFIVTPFPDFP